MRSSEGGSETGWVGWVGAAIVAGVSLLYAGSLTLAKWGHQASADSYYHFAVAREIARGSFRSEAQGHLPWTILADLPVDHYFGFHLLLAPFASLPDPVWGMKLATLVLFTAVPLSAYWFLSRLGVRAAWAWALLPLLFSHLDWRYLMLRGGSWLVVVSVMFLYVAFFVPRERTRWLGIVLVSYVATLSYQGGLLLMPLHLSALVSVGLLRRDALPGKRWLELLLTALGLALGFTLNPYMDARASTWRFTQFHLANMGGDPANLYPEVREFGAPPLANLPSNPQYILAPLCILLVAGWVVAGAFRKRPPSLAAAVTLGPAVAGLLMTARVLRIEEYATLWGTLFLALALPRWTPPIPWLRRAARPLVATTVGLLLFIKWPDTFNLLGRHLPGAQYRGARQVLEAFRGPPVLNIAEGDYTTLRWEDPDVVAVQGLSHYFLFPNRPVFDDVMTIRGADPPVVKLHAVRRFYDRGVRLIAVQWRNPSYVLFADTPRAFRPVFESPLVGADVWLGSTIFVIDHAGLESAIGELSGECEP